MKSSEPAPAGNKTKAPAEKAGPAGFTGALYSLLALYIPLPLLVALVSSLLALARLVSPFTVPWAALLGPAFLSGLGASFYYSLMKHHKASHVAATIRGAVVVMAAAYPLGSLPRSGLPFPARFLPGAANILASLCALYVWVQVIFLKGLFEAQELLESYTGKNRGEKLRQFVLEDAALLSSLHDQIAKTRRIVLVQIVIVFILALVRLVLGIPLGPGEFILLPLICLNGSCLSGILEFFGQEHYHAGEGMAVENHDRLRRFWGILGFSLAALAGALLLSPGRGILPFSLITGLLARIAAFLNGNPRSVRTEAPPAEAPSLMPMAGMEQNPFLEALGEGEPSPFWDWLQYGFIVLGALLFIRFMTKPLFDRGRAGGPLWKRLRALAAGWFGGLKAALSGLWAALGRRGASIHPEDTGALHRVAGDLFAVYSPKRQREIRGTITLFARIILWGIKTCQVSWQPAYGPGEYCALLKAGILSSPPSAEAPGEDRRITAARGVVRCGELFERALYAGTVLSDGEKREFKALVEDLTASR